MLFLLKKIFIYLNKKLSQKIRKIKQKNEDLTEKTLYDLDLQNSGLYINICYDFVSSCGKPTESGVKKKHFFSTDQKKNKHF